MIVSCAVPPLRLSNMSVLLFFFAFFAFGAAARLGTSSFCYKAAQRSSNEDPGGGSAIAVHGQVRWLCGDKSELATLLCQYHTFWTLLFTAFFSSSGAMRARERASWALSQIGAQLSAGCSHLPVGIWCRNSCRLLTSVSGEG